MRNISVPRDRWRRAWCATSNGATRLLASSQNGPGVVHSRGLQPWSLSSGEQGALPSQQSLVPKERPRLLWGESRDLGNVIVCLWATRKEALPLNVTQQEVFPMRTDREEFRPARRR